MCRWRIVVVEDSEAFANILEQVLQAEEDFEVVGIAHSKVQAFVTIRQEIPNIVLLDLNLSRQSGAKDTSGLEVMREISKEQPEIRFLILTINDDEETLFQAYQEGANGYLLKKTALDAIPSKVRLVAGGEDVFPPALADRIRDEFARMRRRLSSQRELAEMLSTREIEVLEWIGRRLTNLEIAARLFVSEETIKTHVSNILKKLKVNSRKEAAKYAQEHGLVKD